MSICRDFSKAEMDLWFRCTKTGTGTPTLGAVRLPDIDIELDGSIETSISALRAYLSEGYTYAEVNYGDCYSCSGQEGLILKGEKVPTEEEVKMLKIMIQKVKNTRKNAKIEEKEDLEKQLETIKQKIEKMRV